MGSVSPHKNQWLVLSSTATHNGLRVQVAAQGQTAGVIKISPLWKISGEIICVVPHYFLLIAICLIWSDVVKSNAMA